jgi:hypothetical protein
MKKVLLGSGWGMNRSVDLDREADRNRTALAATESMPLAEKDYGYVEGHRDIGREYDV